MPRWICSCLYSCHIRSNALDGREALPFACIILDIINRITNKELLLSFTCSGRISCKASLLREEQPKGPILLGFLGPCLSIWYNFIIRLIDAMDKLFINRARRGSPASPERYLFSTLLVVTDRGKFFYLDLYI